MWYTFPMYFLKWVIFLPLPPIYDVLISLLIIVPLGLMFFSSVFLYNKLCERDLLTADETYLCRPVESKLMYAVIFAISMAVSSIFYLLITHDVFDLSLIFFVPPFTVSVLCERKNGFVPLLSVVLCGLCVLGRILYYCLFQGIWYGLSIVLSLLIAFAVIFIPKIIFDRKKSIDIFLILQLSLMASYFSPIYAIIFVGAVYLLMVLCYEIPNLVSVKRKGRPVFRFKFPILMLSSAVFAAMLLI